jgi:hypothetical protein
MKKMLLVFAIACLAATSAWALTGTYGWENCGTVFGTYPATGITATNVGAPDPVMSGIKALKLERTSASTTQSYVAFVTGLTTGDVITGLVYIYDTTASGNASGRIWAHYGHASNVMDAVGSASGPADYSGVPLGWGPVPNSGTAYAWTFAPTDMSADALIIEVRNYGNTPPLNVIWVDEITVTAPDRPGVVINFPIAGPSAVDNSTWGGIKSLYR